MIGKFAIVAIALTIAATLNGYSPTPTRSGDSWALLYARGLAIGHTYAVKAALDSPMSTGTVNIPAAGIVPGLSISACKSTTVVASWLVPNSYPGELPIATQLMSLASDDPGAGTASGGMVAAQAGKFIPLPCTVPDGVPVMATAFRS